MYSPKIREDLIPYLYRIARHYGIPMTGLVNQYLEHAIAHFKATGIFEEIEQEETALKELADHLEGIINGKRKKTAEVIELLRKIA